MKTPYYLLLLTLCLLTVALKAQQITGTWKGKVKSGNIELKLVKSGDSLVGTSYYYTSKTNFRRYSVKGYFDSETNDVIWWDDALLEDKLGKGIFTSASGDALLSVADFNCPGEKEMRLDGSSSLRDDKDNLKGPVHLQKVTTPVFADDWDFVIDNYTAGANDPYIIDSIVQLAGGIKPYPEERLPAAANIGTIENKKEQPVITVPAPGNKKAAASTNEEKFSSRKKNLQMVIPVTGKNIELRFYDNAAIDGDSIAIFLNGHLLREHILLGGEPQTIKLSADDLQDDNEVVIVAENLGTIPPNTSYLVAIVGGKQYEARLFADEGSSALVRFIKNVAK